MVDTYRVYSMFVASPGDVADERQLLDDAVHRINQKTRDGLAALINVRKWDHLPPSPPDTPEDTLQDRIMNEVRRCDLFVVILYKRYGTTLPGHRKSNTEREIDLILERWRAEPRLKLLFYFRQLPTNDDAGSQEQRVRDLRAKLEKLQIQYATYDTPDDFKEQFTHDAYDLLMRIQASTYKRALPRNFWRLGGEDIRPHEPRLAILYPPAERKWFSDGDSDDYWERRLTTQIAFEDYKAIQKIEKTLRLIPFNAYRVYPSSSPPQDLARVNRVWLCLSRNRAGLQHLRQHTDRRFSFRSKARSKARRPHIIEWRNDAGATVTVGSPMAEYLQRQRSTMNSDGDWRGEFAQVVAKDYAVLARLTVKHADADAEPLREYFLGGIRGLGTWGAAWLLDRRYKMFRTIDPYANFERLLEVVYLNGRIHAVNDVSDRPQSYFRAENRTAVIRRHIEELG